MENKQAIRVRLQAPEEAAFIRAFDILKQRIQERCPAEVVIVEKGEDLCLEIDPSLPAEAFRIRQESHQPVCLAGGSPRGLLAGVGKFLRTSGYRPEEAVFLPSAWRGTSQPQSTLRGMYFATHFHNWYHEASEEEIARYVEDLALWGVNAVMVCFPFIDLSGWDDPECAEAVEMIRKHARAVKRLGLLFGLGTNNALFSGAPQDLRATPLPDPTGRRGNSGNPICPSLPAGQAYLLENFRQLFARIADIGVDFLVHWPYDEGGCACPQCSPWGSNGYLRLSRDLTRLGREFFPGLQSILSTWMFDTPPEGEWQGLSAALQADSTWVDAILADAHEDFPRYPLDVEVPGGLPLVNFPEISMWGNSPWGGVGANPLPARFQALWDQVQARVRGGFPYSEGIYEDLNKAMVVQFYWDGQRTARETLREYIQYVFSPRAIEDVLTLLDLFEAAASRSYQRQSVDPLDAQRAASLAASIQAGLPDWARQGWRWQLLEARAILDRERFGGAGLESPEAETAMLRLCQLYHCQLVTDDPYHHRVRPPLRRAISRRGEC